MTVVEVSESNSESRREGSLEIRELSRVELRSAACGARRSYLGVERFVNERSNSRKEGMEHAQIMVYVSMLEKDQI